jgi:DinB family protein
VNAIGMLVQQLETVNLRLHHVARAVTPELATAAAATSANPVGFLLWHIPRSQDWAVQTALRGVPEVAFGRPWSEMASIAIPGIGTGFSSAEAAQMARRIDVKQLLAYADAVHVEVVSWVQGLRESDLDAIPDVAAHNAGRLEYQTPGFLAEMDSGPEHDQAVGDVGGQPAWLYLTSVCVTHLHRHLGELDLTLGILTGRAA